MKVEIEFDQNESGNIIPLSLGRILIGNNIGRLYFTKEGKTVLFIEEDAIKDGSIVLLKDPGPVVGFGKKEYA